ncbi:hypothetical protein EDB81DRAFT_861372 [Dactylonectria macrodidyma]|uniref:Uncharacterized protein n=1 Tax=Dactylonectria macrodidyma TaxID=307937 RepID=A0A9P9DLF3_9HYPO|nr:hypothetical protein EDB81DRAFT_861372 [Dactylonectria macrodidyma]
MLLSPTAPFSARGLECGHCLDVHPVQFSERHRRTLQLSVIRGLFTLRHFEDPLRTADDCISPYTVIVLRRRIGCATPNEPDLAQVVRAFPVAGLNLPGENRAGESSESAITLFNGNSTSKSSGFVISLPNENSRINSPGAILTLSDENMTSETIHSPQPIPPQRILRTTVEVRKYGWPAIFNLDHTKYRKSPSSVSLDETEEESKLLFSLPSARFHVELRVRRGSLTPLSISIQFPHVLELEDDRDLSARLDKILQTGDLVGFQHLLTEGSITPTTRLTSPVMCPGEKISCSVNDVPSDVYYTAVGCNPRCACAFLALRADSLTTPEFRFLLRTTIDPRLLVDCVEAYKGYCSENWTPFHNDIWAVVVKWFPTLPKHQEDETDLIHSREWKGQGLRGKRRRRWTALQVILDDAEDPGDSFASVKSWVSTLDGCGVDIPSYLKVEMRGCDSGWVKSTTYNRLNNYERQLAFQRYKGWDLPCWVILDPNSSRITELATAFPHLTYGTWGTHKVTRKHHSYALRTKDHRVWKTIFQETHEFPFCSSLVIDSGCIEDIDCPWLGSDDYEYNQRSPEALMKACDLATSRFERKRLAKIRKAARIGKYKLLEGMPGSWVD